MKRQHTQSVWTFGALALLGILLACASTQAKGKGKGGKGLLQSPWLTFRHDGRGTARSGGSVSSNPVALWSVELTDGRNSNCAPIVDTDGTVYVGTWGGQDGAWSESIDGKLFAVTSKGRIKWVFDPGAPEQPSQGQHNIWGTVESAVAIDTQRSVLYFGRGDGKVYALNRSGNKLWEFATFPTTPERLPEQGGQVISPIRLGTDGTLYFGTVPYTDEGVHAVFAVNPNGTEKWRYVTEDDVGGAVAIADDGTLYAGNVYALASAGNLLWRYQRNGHWIGQIAIGDEGTLYAGGLQVTGFYQGRTTLIALQPNGVEKWVWQADANSSLEHSVAAMGIGRDGTIYVGTTSIQMEAYDPDDFGRFYALEDDTDSVDEKWRIDVNSGVPGGVIDKDEVVYFSTRGDVKNGVPGKVYAVKPDGTKKWKNPVQVEGELWWGGNIALVDNVLYVSTAPSADVVNLFPSPYVPRLYAIGKRQPARR